MTTEKKYHINPDTGNPGPCDARIKCPFGMPLDSHFSTPEDARAAYERLNKDKLLPTIDALDLDQASTEKVMSGIEARSIVSHFINDQGGFTPPSHREPTYAEAETEYDGFYSLGSGNEANVYLNPNGKRVVKVPNDFLQQEEPWEGKRHAEYERRMARQEAAYAAFPHEELKAQGVEYVPTTYTHVPLPNGKTMTVVSQHYLSPEAYRDPAPGEGPMPFTLGERSPLHRRLAEVGFHDVEGNFKVRRSDGHLVFFDAL